MKRKKKRKDIPDTAGKGRTVGRSVGGEASQETRETMDHNPFGASNMDQGYSSNRGQQQHVDSYVQDIGLHQYDSLLDPKADNVTVDSSVHIAQMKQMLAQFWQQQNKEVLYICYETYDTYSFMQQI
jgi:hypothetical protein